MTAILNYVFTRNFFVSLFRPRLPQAEWLVVGLGNPGPKYAATRHNVGYLVVDELASDLAPVAGTKALVQVVGNVAYMRSTTFMNTSGEAVAPLAAKLGVDPEHIIVVHDELDLPAGKVRLKRGGNENGHNGLKSITEHLGTRDYLRVRIGIGRPPKGTAVVDYVLAATEGDPQESILVATDAVRLITTVGLAKAQNEIHSR